MAIYKVVEVDDPPIDKVYNLEACLNAFASEGARVISHTYVAAKGSSGAVYSIILEYDD